jgi:hypothetical protein
MVPLNLKVRTGSGENRICSRKYFNHVPYLRIRSGDDVSLFLDAKHGAVRRYVLLQQRNNVLLSTDERTKHIE